MESGDYTPADLCFSLQETVFAMLVEITGRRVYGARLVATGGDNVFAMKERYIGRHCCGYRNYG